jgi:type VI protein secretion system component Hcp
MRIAMKHLLFAILLVLPLVALAPFASADTAVLIVDGNDIAVNSYSFGTSSSSGTGASGGGSGAPSIDSLTVNIDPGSYSTDLSGDFTRGTPLNPVVLDIFTTGTTDLVATITLSDAFITSISFDSGSSGATPTENVTFVFDKEAIIFNPTGSGGTGSTNIPEPSSLALLTAGLAALAILSTRKTL